MKILVLKGIKKTFGEKEILKGLSLEVEEGEIVAILGVSGAGKSSLLRIVAGLERPDQGEVYVAGKLATAGTKVLLPPHQRGVGFIFQNLGLWEHLNVYQHLEFVFKARFGRVDEDRLRAILDFLGLSSLVKRRPAELSGGERQRLALARALAQEPRILLLDEPFSNLDLPRKKKLHREFLRIREEKGITIVYVTHDPLDVKLMADRVVILHQGEIVQSGTLKELLQNPAHHIVKALLEI